MDDELDKVISRDRDDDANRGYPYVNTLTSPPTSFRIRAGAVTDFITSYCDIVSRSGTNSFYVAEVPKPEMHNLPLAIHGMFRFPQMPESESLNFLVYSIAARYQRAILEKLQISQARSELIFVYLGRYSSADHSYRYRLQFPYCRIDQAEMYGILRENVINQISMDLPWNHAGIRPLPISGWDTQIEPKPYQYLTLYGSRERRDLEPLELVEIVGHITLGSPNDHHDDLDKQREIINNQMYPEPQPRGDLISPSMHSFFRRGIPEKKFSVPTPSEDPEWWMPVFLSIYFASGIDAVPQPGLERPVRLPISSQRSDSGRFTDFSIACELIDTCLREHRAQKEFYFKDLGRALYRITNGAPEGMAKWLEFGERRGADLRSEVLLGTAKTIEELWFTFEGCHVTLKTIMYWAREDCEEAKSAVFTNWQTDWCAPDMKAACAAVHAYVAKALYKKFCLDYCVSSISNNSWYEYRNHHWTHVDKGYTISIALTEQFTQMFHAHQANVTNRKAAERDPSVKHSLGMEADAVSGLIKKLGDHKFKTQVLAEAMNYFHIPEFSDLCDNAANLICTQNGVIEMQLGRFMFRNGKPEDYLTLHTGVKYEEKFTWDSREVHAACDWINQLMVNPNLVEIMKRTLGCLLYGGNLDKLLFAWTGPPDAGKSTFVGGICMALGKYAVKGDNGVLYGSRSGDGPSPSLARLRGVRVQIFEELETERGSINSGFVKRATGNDTFFARFLNQNGGEIHPLFKTIFVCNDIPSFSTFEPAMRSRLFPEPFDSRWSDNAPKDPQECQRLRVFQKDRYFQSKLPGLARALLWLMVQWYPKYHEYGLSRLKEIEGVAAKYWADQDYYQRFIDMKMHRYDKINGQVQQQVYVDVQMAHASFGPWFRANYPSLKPPNSKQFIQGISLHLDPPVNNVWYGVAMVGIGGFE